MHKKLFLFICSASTLVLITAYLGATPALSAPGDKEPEIQKPADKDVIKPGDLKDGSKGKETVKKKAVKKAGTAVTAGVVGAKIKSNVNGKITKDKE